MGIKYNEDKEIYTVSFSRRHPITKKSNNIRRTGIKTKTEAIKVHNQIKNELLRKFYDVQYPFWSEVVEKFLIDFSNKGLSQGTILTYESCLKLHTSGLWENKRISEISTTEIRDLVIDDLKKYSEPHRKNVLKFIRAVFNFAIDNNIIHRNPCPKLKFKKGEKIKAVLKEDEMKHLLKKAKSKEIVWFPIWALACYTGLRNGELYALKWKNVDLKKRLMIISEAWTKENGFKETKSGDDRIVEIAQSLMPLMNKLFQEKSDEFVLPRIDSWKTGNQSKVLKDFLNEISLPLIRFHDLRASWATIMLSKGVEPIKVMAMGGWKDLKTMQIYIRKSGIHIQGITDSLNFL